MTVDVERIRTIFRERLNMEVPSIETDLLHSGLLDSLLIVDLLLHIERDLGRSLPMEELELDDFRTLVTIAQCVERKGRLSPRGSPPPQPHSLGARD